MEQNNNVYEQDRARAEKYISNVYSSKVPPPEKPSTAFWNLVGLKAIFFSASSLGAILFSSIRTGGYFFIVERMLLSKYNIPDSIIGILSFVAFVSALFAFEGYALAIGFAEGERLTGIADGKGWGFVLSLATITLVGVFSGLEIVEMPEATKSLLNVITAVVTSISAATIAFFGGKNLGYTVAEFRNRRQDIREKHQAEYNDWRDGAYKSFTSTEGGFKKRVQSFVQNEQKNEPVVHQNVQDVFIPEKKSVQAFNFVNSYVQDNGSLPSVSVVERGAGVSRGSASYAIHDFIDYNREDLIRDGIVTEERADAARKNVSKRNSK